MPRVDKACGNALIYIVFGAVLALYKKRNGLVNVIGSIRRFIFFTAGAFRFSVAPFGFAFLDMRGIKQHYAAEFRSCFRGKNISAKSRFCQFGKFSGMVYMRVSKKYAVDIRNGDGKFAIFVNIRALLHSAIDKDFFAVNFQQRARACNLMRRAEKFYFHTFTFPFVMAQTFHA